MEEESEMLIGDKMEKCFSKQFLLLPQNRGYLSRIIQKQQIVEEARTSGKREIRVGKQQTTQK